MAIRIRKTITVGLLAITTMAVAACSSHTSPNADAAGGGHTQSSTSAAKGAGGSDVNACSLLTVAQASSLVGRTYTSATPKTIATGQDSCTYDRPDGDSFLVIIYQPNSGVSLQMLSAADSGTPISGVGDKAVVSDIELDVQTGDRLIAVLGAGGARNDAPAIAVAKSIIAALH